MKRWRIPLILALILIPTLPFAAPGILYQYGASQIPVELKPVHVQYPDESRHLYWRSQGGTDRRIEIRRLNAMTYLMYAFMGRTMDRDANTGMSVLMQVGRYHCASPASGPQRHGNLVRHLVELACVIRISNEWTPEQIIDTALDQIRFGRDTRGLDSAAMTYYGKAIAALTPPQTLALLTIGRGPYVHDPDCHRERFAQRYRLMAHRAGFDEDSVPLDAAMQEMRITPCNDSSSH